MTKYTLPDKSGKPESLKKQSQQFESFSANVPIVGKDYLRAFYRLLYLQFWDSSNQWKNTVQQRFYEQCERYFYIEIIVTITPTYLVTNSLSSCFCPFLQTKKQGIRFSTSWWSGNQKYFCFLFIASRVLFQTEFNRLL